MVVDLCRTDQCASFGLTQLSSAAQAAFSGASGLLDVVLVRSQPFDTDCMDFYACQCKVYI
jgi:hypothetical protein